MPRAIESVVAAGADSPIKKTSMPSRPATHLAGPEETRRHTPYLGGTVGPGGVNAACDCLAMPAAISPWY